MTKSRRPPALLVLLLASVVLPRLGHAAAGVTTISRLLSGRVYVEVGANAGLQEGDTLRVVRGNRTVAALRIGFAAATRSACDTLWTRARLVVGDEVRFAAAVPAVAVPAIPTTGAVPAVGKPLPDAIARKPARVSAPEVAAVPPPMPVSAPATPSRDSIPRRPALTRLTYLAGTEAFVDAGRLDGVRVGDTLTVVRAGKAIAALRVLYSASKRASCDTLWTRATLALGDDVRYLAAAAPAPPPAAAAPAPVLAATAAPRTSAPGKPRLRGRVGARWLSVKTDGGEFQQPALDLRFDGFGAGADHMDLSVDLRSRRTTRNFGGSSRQTDELARVYRASVTLRSRNALHALTLGRQNSPTLASISLFDGVLARTGGPHYSVGVFSGTQPDPEHYHFSSEIVQSGVFAECHQAPLAQRRYSVAVGGVTSQQAGQPNRDFLFAQGNWFSTRLMTSVTQEVDVNRGWKRALGERTLSPTSTFGTVRWMPTRWLGANTGFDNRRGVRLYRDRLTPETQFDDAYRQGAWVGGDAQMLQHLRFAGEIRGSGGADRSHAWNWSAEAYRLGPMHAAVRGRVSQFDGSTVTSRLSSASAGFDPRPLSHVEVAGGARRTRVEPATTDDIEWWQSVDVDMTVGRRWYLNAGWEHDYGGSSGDTRQVHGGLSWRF